MAPLGPLEVLVGTLLRNVADHAAVGGTVRVGWLAPGDGCYVEAGGPSADEPRTPVDAAPVVWPEPSGRRSTLDALCRDRGWEVALVGRLDGSPRFEVTGVERVQEA